MINAVDAEFPIVPVSRPTRFEFQYKTKISKVPWFKQFVVLSRRMLLQLRRNKVQNNYKI